MSEPFPTLARCRSRARLLLSHLRSNDRDRALAAAQRFGRLQSFRGVPPDALLEPDRVRLKHALTLIAVELGEPSWPALKAKCTALERATADAGALPSDAMYVERMTLWLNQWFPSYDEARAALDQDGGYLLPFRHHFFVTTGEAIAELGLDPADEDWRRIGFDWVRPADAAAHARLVAQRRAAMQR